MIALVLLAIVPVAMWVAQTAVLRANGMPVRWRIDSRGAPGRVKTVGRAVTQVALGAVIVAYPMLRGEGVIAYYGRLLPATGQAAQFVQGAAVSTLCLCALFGAWLAAGRVQIDFHHSAAKTRRRLLLLAPTAVFGAVVEELLFRGVLLADLLRYPAISTALAIGMSTVVFAGAHYVRSVKRRWTIFGHLMLGLLLCVAYVRSGSLWLPMGLHAGGIFAIMGTRPFFWYKGPAWLTGASIFPFAGVVGIAGLGLLTGFVVHSYPAN